MDRAAEARLSATSDPSLLFAQHTQRVTSADARTGSNWTGGHTRKIESENPPRPGHEKMIA